jgi:hypothetical protein
MPFPDALNRATGVVRRINLYIMKEIRLMQVMLPIVDIRCRFNRVRRDPLSITPPDPASAP